MGGASESAGRHEGGRMKQAGGNTGGGRRRTGHDGGSQVRKNGRDAIRTAGSSKGGAAPAVRTAFARSAKLQRGVPPHACPTLGRRGTLRSYRSDPHDRPASYLVIDRLSPQLEAAQPPAGGARRHCRVGHGGDTRRHKRVVHHPPIGNWAPLTGVAHVEVFSSGGPPPPTVTTAHSGRGGGGDLRDGTHDRGGGDVSGVGRVNAKARKGGHFPL